MDTRTILVTGCAGFIGSNFVERFRETLPQIAVVGIDDFSTGRRDRLSRNMIFYEGSICDETLVGVVFQTHRPEYVFHFAALPRVAQCNLHPAKTAYVNSYGTVLLLEKSRNYSVRRFIYSSSSAVYGRVEPLPANESTNIPNPLSPYAIQKYVGEPFCKSFSTLFGLDTVCLRYFNVFGPGQYGDSPYATVVGAWLESLYFPGEKKPYLESDGKQSRDFCYVDDVVNANILAMKSERNLGGEVFNIGSGQSTDLLTVKRLIEKYTDNMLDLETRPERLGDIRHTLADISKARDMLGYEPSISFEQGLIKTIQWFEERLKRGR